MVYALAERLGIRVPEVLCMTVDEFAGWAAYYKVLAEKRQKREG
jgi:hypothetical protein